MDLMRIKSGEIDMTDGDKKEIADIVSGLIIYGWTGQVTKNKNGSTEIASIASTFNSKIIRLLSRCGAVDITFDDGQRMVFADVVGEDMLADCQIALKKSKESSLSQ